MYAYCIAAVRFSNNNTNTSIMIPIRTIHYLFTPWNRVVLEKLTGLQLVKRFPAFYGTRR
jgi:hypothetical protein